MNNMKKYLNNRYEEFWYDIYNIEKKEFKNLKLYIDYVDKNTRNYMAFNLNYDYIKNLFMNMHLDYLHEAFSSLLLGNYNSCSCLIRIIIENYVTFLLIKKYKNKNLWKDWYLFGYKKTLKIINQEPYHTKISTSFEMLCKELNFDNNLFNNNQPYGWISRCITLKNYNFKNICKLFDNEIYKDFEYLSSYIHNNDIIAKTQFIHMHLLTKFLFMIFNYTDKMLKEYNFHIYKRNEYNNLCNQLLSSLDDCCNYRESIP